VISWRAGRDRRNRGRGFRFGYGWMVEKIEKAVWLERTVQEALRGSDGVHRSSG
jgi:hypothetical protein